MLKRLRSAHPMLYCLVAEVLFLGMLFVASLLSLLLILFVVRDIDAVDDYMLTFMQEAAGVLVAWLFLARTGKSGLLRRRGSGFFNGLLVGMYPLVLIGYSLYTKLMFGMPEDGQLQPAFSIFSFFLSMALVGVAEEFIFRGVIAQSLLERGCAVTVIEGSPTLLPRNLDAEAAGVALRELGKIPNLTLKFGASVKEITGTGVRIDGEEIPADLVMVSAGTRANIELAAAAGLQCNRGIVVDDQLRSSQPEIFAAGDCAEVNGTLYGLYGAARAMGAVAGANLAGAAETFQPEAFPARLNVFGLKIFSAGVLKGASEKSETNPDTGAFRKLFYDDAGHLIGCILIGDLKEALKLQAEIDAGPAR